MMNLQAYIPKIAKGYKHYAVIGPISSGKTTLLNSIFNINEDVGLGEITSVAKPVYKN
jgi:ABC-type cobalamin/Fe3+-siderophores transport system ATPase subunit